MHSVELTDPYSQYILRDCRASDAEAIYEAAMESVDHVGKWMPWLTSEYSVELQTTLSR